MAIPDLLISVRRRAERRRFLLRVSHQQVAAIGHDGYQHGLRNGHTRPDAALDASTALRFWCALLPPHA